MCVRVYARLVCVYVCTHRLVGEDIRAELIPQARNRVGKKENCSCKREEQQDDGIW